MTGLAMSGPSGDTGGMEAVSNDLGAPLAVDLGREWLLADGAGGYAAGTRADVPTRRYHGLLIAPLPPPRGRTLVLARCEAILRDASGAWPLDASWYEPGVVHPDGWRHLEGFEPHPVPTWIHAVGGRRVRRRLGLRSGGGAAGIIWELLDGPPAELLVRPLLTCRSHHGVLRETDFEPVMVLGSTGLRWRRAPGEPEVVLAWSGRPTEAPACFYRRVLLPVERDRGYACVEDLHAPVQLALELAPGQAASLQVSLPDLVPGEEAAFAVRRTAPATSTRELLEAGRETFVIRSPAGKPGIVAGYPWFGEWGRDTMIALPGLLLATGHGDRAREILRTWAGRVRGGLIPNRLQDAASETEDTGSADAPLLFVRAVAAWEAQAGPGAAADAALEEAELAILEGLHAGTAHGIGVDAADGLLAAGLAGRALTWMDAITDGVPATPRRGKPVELNALYLEALRQGARIAARRGDAGLLEVLRERAGHLVRGLGRYVDDTSGVLRDVVDPEDPRDGVRLRPNLLFALALSPSPLPVGARRAARAAVEARLLTRYGLRTLDPADPDYRGSYAGDQRTRDAAYHQGTVWPWLLGPYVDAVLAVRGRHRRVRLRLAEVLWPLVRRAREEGTLPEVFAGDRPHIAGGCPAQAWSVAEVLRAQAALERLTDSAPRGRGRRTRGVRRRRRSRRGRE